MRQLWENLFTGIDEGIKKERVLPVDAHYFLAVVRYLDFVIKFNACSLGHGEGIKKESNISSYAMNGKNSSVNIFNYLTLFTDFKFECLPLCKSYRDVLYFDSW